MSSLSSLSDKSVMLTRPEETKPDSVLGVLLSVWLIRTLLSVAGYDTWGKISLLFLSKEDIKITNCYFKFFIILQTKYCNLSFEEKGLTHLEVLKDYKKRQRFLSPQLLNFCILMPFFCLHQCPLLQIHTKQCLLRLELIQNSRKRFWIIYQPFILGLSFSLTGVLMSPFDIFGNGKQ